MPHRSLFTSALAAALLIGLPLGFQHAVAQEPAPVEEPAPETPPTETVVADEVSEETAPAEAPQAVEEAPQKVEPEMVQTSGDQKLRFNFASTSWKDVLLWLSEEANLSLKADRYPEGTLSFVDPSREYSVSEALDQLNRQLLDRGFAMVRRGRLLMLIDLESPLAGKYMENIAELVVPEALDQRGDSDIVKCIFPLGAMTPEAADEELRQMLGPSMPMTILGSARQVVITDTVARLKAIRKVLDDATNAGLEVTEITLQHRAADEILVLARPLLGLPEDSNSTDSIRIAIDPFGDRMFVTGEPSAVALLERIVEKADKPLVVEGGETQAVALPELRTYPIAVADPPTVFDVMSTLLAGLPDTRLSLDPASNSLVVFARPETHTIVQSALDKLEGKGVQVDTIQLRRLEPSAALLTINKFFGKTEENNAGPIVDGDPITGRLWIRGTAEQIQLTKDLIDRLEGNDSMGNLTDRIRVLPYSGQNATELLEQAEMMWGVSGRKNRIRMISPSSGKSTSGFPERRLRRDESEEEEEGIDTNEEAAAETPQTAGRAMINNPFRLAVQRDANEAPADSAGETAPQTPAEKQPAEDKTGSDIVITMTPQGMIVASEDPAALTEFEDLMRTLSEQTTYSNQPPTVFWLKFVKASVASGMVTSILGGDSGGGSMGGDAGLLGELGGGLGMLGGLMGLGGGGGDTGGGGGPILTATGSVSIVPDDRLNALFVQANGVDMQMIETILEVIDREESPEDVQTVARPRLIPVIYSQASEVATIIKSVFTDRIAGDTSRGGNNNQPKPEDIIAALRGGGGRGGRGGGGGGAQAEKSEPAKISIGIDERSNTLIVTATPQDFEEVRLLVEQIDQAGAESEETTSVIALNGSVNPQVVQQALESVLGRPVASTNSTSTTSSNSSNNNASSSNNGPSTSDIQRRIEAFRAMQGGGGFGGRPSGAAGGRPGGSGGPTSGGGRTGGGRPGGGRGGR